MKYIKYLETFIKHEASNNVIITQNLSKKNFAIVKIEIF